MQLFIRSIQWLVKYGQALAGGLGGVAIAAVGYNSAQATQTEAALSGIYGLGTLLPAILYTVVLLILWFLYPLNKKQNRSACR